MAGFMEELFEKVMKDQWEDVVNMYKDHSQLVSVKITTSGDTALHLAVSDGRADTLARLVEALGSNAKDALQIKNEHGNTPLHLAAAMGNVSMCQCITKVDKGLVEKRNDDGHTPLFLTALYGKLNAFISLYKICKPDGIQKYCRGSRGDTILHTAIDGEHFELALFIMNDYEELMFLKDERGLTPLHLLASKPSVFRSCTHFSWLENIVYSYITVKELPDVILPDQTNSQTGITVQEPPDVILPDQINNQTGQQSRDMETPSYRWFPPNYRKCCHFLNLIYSVLLVIFGWGKLVSNSRANGEHAKSSGPVGDAENPKEELEDESLCIPCFRFSGDNGDNAKGHGQTGFMVNAKERPQGEDQPKFPPNYRTGFELMKLVFKLMLIILGLGHKEIQKIKHIKETHVWSLQIVKKTLKSARNYGYDAAGRLGLSTSKSSEEFSDMELLIEPPTVETNQSPKDAAAKPERMRLDRAETPILTAASNGIKEMVELILDHFPIAIYDRNSDKKNIVLLAAENRQPHVYHLLKQKNIKESVFESLFHALDINGNSALHLAANLYLSPKPWTVPRSALQMSWEIKWYEYVKSWVGPNLPMRNKEGKTAMEIFKETHKLPAKEEGKWLFQASDSCSVVAALIATVAFAASATVPGSTEKGKPVLEKELAFQVFSISSLVSLCCSVTSLIMFLSILISRYQVSEFSIDLPKKLLWGMSSLLISIAAQLVSFCSGHFFILNDRLRSAAVLIYAITCLPATLFAMGQLPLYIDLICAIFTKVPLYDGRFAGKKVKFH